MSSFLRLDTPPRALYWYFPTISLVYFCHQVMEGGDGVQQGLGD